MRRLIAKWLRNEPAAPSPEQIELRQTIEEMKVIARSLDRTQRRMATQVQRLVEEEENKV